jgi:hypothetical protein
VVRVFAVLFTLFTVLLAGGAVLAILDGAGVVSFSRVRVTCDRAGGTCAVRGALGTETIPVLDVTGAGVEGSRFRHRAVLETAEGPRALTGWNRRPALVAAWRDRTAELDAFAKGGAAARVDVVLPRSELPSWVGALLFAAGAFFTWTIARNAVRGVRGASARRAGDELR